MHTALTKLSMKSSYILRDSGARVVVASEDVRHVAATAAAAAGGVEHTILTSAAGQAPDDGGSGPTWDELLAAGAPYEPIERDPDDVAALVYTSGTTGRSKGAMLSRGNLAANQDQVLATPLAITEDDTVLGVLPLFHIYAMNVGLGASIRAGATILLVERFDPQRTLEDIERHRVTVILGAPPMYVAWLDTPGARERDLSSVRMAVSGAAPLPASVLNRFADELGVPIWEGYGLTEASPAVTTNAMGEEIRPGSVGKPLPGVEVRLVDDRGRDVDLGDPGEVWVRGDNVFSGYWNDDAATAEALVDGWLCTGDVGVFDEDGYLRLVDRKRDLIIVSGFNVYPREVEEVLYRHPNIAEAAVIGVAHRYTGEAVKAVVVPRHGTELTEDDVLDHCRRSLARFKCPDIVVITDQLPHTSTGKVLRRLLRDAGEPVA